jgi:hypothetical protein
MRTICYLAVAAVISSSSLTAQEDDWQAVVLMASSVAQADGSVSVTLFSGRTVNFSSEEWSASWSEGVDKALAAQRDKEHESIGYQPPSDAAARPGIRAKCTADWTDDFKMQKYCQDKQFEALRVLRGRVMMQGALATIRKKCSEDWSDDYKMRDYCEKKQVEALRELQR